MEEINRHYCAFISYSHRDKADVLAFHRFLENYHLPRAVRKLAPDAPKRFAPVFIDRDNLAGTQLDDRLRQALRNADYLVVMCSPSSAKSSYVNDEVSYYMSLGRADHIIPYILSGTPNAQNAEEECFVPALRELNPLGSDVRDLGRKKAQLRVIASMLNIDLDLLVQKEKHRTIKRTACAAGLAALIGVCVWSQYNYYKVPRVSYYQDYVEVNGVPQGIGKSLTKEERSGVLGTYAITKLAGKVQTLAYVNAAGEPDTPELTTAKEENAIRDYTYDDDGDLTKVELKDKNGKFLASWEYTSDGQEVSLRTASGDTVSLENFELLLSEEEIANEKTNGVKGYRMDYDDSTGWLEKKLFTAFSGSRSSVPDDLGTYGREYEYTDDGKIYRMYYLDQRGERTTRATGAAYLEYTYDDQGRVLTQTNYDAQGYRALGNESISQLQTVYDGNTITLRGYDCDGNLAEIASLGAEQRISVYDDNGNLIETEYLDADGNRIIGSGGYAKCTMEYDSEGHQTRVNFLGADNEPVIVDGYSSRTKEYSVQDGQTTVIEMYYDADGNPTCCDDGYAGLKQITDEAGNVLFLEFYDENGKTAPGKDGYSRVETVINEAGYEAKASYYDEEGAPYLMGGCYAFKTKEYDTDGNCTDLYYFDADGEPVCSEKGYAHGHYTYNSWGKLIKVQYFGTDDAPVLSQVGFASIEYGYDSNGNISSAAYFDDQGNAMTNEDGVHRIEYEYENGRISEVSYYGNDEKPMLKEGAARITMDRDTSGNVLRLCNYGVHSEPILCEDGFYMYEKEYDSEGRLLSWMYYDTSGKLTVNTSLDDGIAGFGYVYEDGQKKQMILWESQDDGIYKRKVVDLTINKTLSVEYYNADETQTTVDDVLKTEYGYDENGERVQKIIWKVLDDGLLRRTTYDLIKEVPVLSEYFNADETPALKNGAHKVEYFSDEDGEMTGYILYGLDGEILEEVHEE